MTWDGIGAWTIDCGWEMDGKYMGGTPGVLLPLYGQAPKAGTYVCQKKKKKICPKLDKNLT